MRDLYLNSQRTLSAAGAQLKVDFWQGNKQLATKFTNYQKQWKLRRENILKLPFDVPGAPKVKDAIMYKPGNKDLIEAELEVKFSAVDLTWYDKLNEASKDFIPKCVGKDALGKLSKLLAMDLHFLLVCDVLHSHQLKPVYAEAILPAGGAGDDDDTPLFPSEAGEGAGGGADAEDSARAAAGDEVHNFLEWPVDKPESIAWSSLGFTPENFVDKHSWFAASIFFFYCPRLPRTHAAENSAIHAGWNAYFKSPMKAKDFDVHPVEYSPEECQWCKDAVATLRGKLDAEGLAQRGLDAPAAETRARRGSAAPSPTKRAPPRGGNAGNASRRDAGGDGNDTESDGDAAGQVGKKRGRAPR